MDPLSVTASVVGVAIPALQCVQLLVDDLQKIIDAPDAIKDLKNDLLTIDKALTSLQVITDAQWESLGQSVLDQSKSAVALTSGSCQRLRADLARWTRHSTDGAGKLSWRDRAMVGLFRQGQISSMSEQLQNCKITLTAVVSIATLYASLQKPHIAEDMAKEISAKEAEVQTALAVTNRQIAALNAKVEALQVTRQDESVDETPADRASALTQVAAEQAALGISHKLLQELLAATKAASGKGRAGENMIMFGKVEKGFQVNVNNSSISGITFN